MSNPMEQLDKSISEAENWATTGWKVTFGSRDVEINSIAEAEALKESFQNRLEAINYWRDIENLGSETAQIGRKAKTALEKGDVKAAINSVYFARYLEKRINEKAPTWSAALSALEASA
ncbi:MAG: hypothetical protein HQL67_06830 [Magnetococcales bacterium]|nr:hypothetical protein [Magnetococcales bacterium]